MFLDLLFPRRCIECGQYDELACVGCIRTHLHIGHSRLLAPLIETVITLGPYNNPFWRRIVEQLKFRGVRDMASACGPSLSRALLESWPLPSGTTLSPIPLHPRRLRQRGYNQSAELAARVSQFSGLPVSDLLVRTRSTKAQSKQERDKRAANLGGAFTCAPVQMQPQLIVLIDDVVTTGSTVTEAAQTLRQYYACPILVLAIARG